MREIRPSGSEGGAGRKPRSYLYRTLRYLRRGLGDLVGVMARGAVSFS